MALFKETAAKKGDLQDVFLLCRSVAAMNAHTTESVSDHRKKSKLSNQRLTLYPEGFGERCHGIEDDAREG